MNGKMLNLFDGDLADNGSRILCKFVLVRMDETVHLVVGPLREFPYHASLVERFCRLHEIASGWEKKPDRYEIFEGDCEILGGGYFDLDPGGRRLSLWGASSVYGSFPAREANLVVESEPIFRGFSVTVQ